MELKETLLMPKTNFEMRGNLPTKEPILVKKWQDEKLYEKMLKNREGGKPFAFHDGPPYANGDMHCGHMLNRILKDMIVRQKSMQGYYVPFIFGFDTHGLPIENQVIKSGVNRKTTPVAEFRQKCREYALTQVKRQQDQIVRLGIMGDYKNAYKNELALSWRFILKDGKTFDDSNYNPNYKFHHFDAYSDKFSELGYACASPYKHLWMTMLEDEAEEKHYYDGKEDCQNGTNWMIEYAGNGEITSKEQLRGLSGFYMISSDESKMANFIPETDGNKNDAIGIDNVQDVLNDASSYRYFTVEQMWGQDQYRIQVHNIDNDNKLFSLRRNKIKNRLKIRHNLLD